MKSESKLGIRKKDSATFSSIMARCPILNDEFNVKQALNKQVTF